MTGDSTAVVEDPCYEGAANLFESYGERLYPVLVDEMGIVTADLPKEGGTLAYTTPSHQYPLGHSMSLQRKRELLQWAYDTKTCLLEDDYDADFRFNAPPQPSLCAFDQH